MKTATYIENGKKRFALLVDDKVYDVESAAAEIGGFSGYSSLEEALSSENGIDNLKELAQKARECNISSISLDDVALASPLQNPQKILGVALNYKDFCARGNLPLPTSLKVFGKYRNAINDPDGCVSIMGRNVTYEGELGVIIGKRGKNISEEEALSYVAGYTCVNDFTANDLTKADVQLFRGKNFDGFVALGPYFVSSDEIPDPQDLEIKTMVDGEVRQESNTNQMVFNVAQIIAFFSSFMTLEPGDVILSGTPAGTALQFDPPRFLKEGQLVTVTIPKIGSLRNHIGK